MGTSIIGMEPHHVIIRCEVRRINSAAGALPANYGWWFNRHIFPGALLNGLIEFVRKSLLSMPQDGNLFFMSQRDQ